MAPAFAPDLAALIPLLASAEIYPPDAEGRIRALPRDGWKPYWGCST